MRAGVPFTPNLVDLGNPTERAALLKLWAIGKFPVLQDDSRDQAVPESSIIIEYLDRHYPPHRRLIPDEPGLALQSGCAIASTISTCICRCRRSWATGCAPMGNRIRTASRKRARSCGRPTR